MTTRRTRRAPAPTTDFNAERTRLARERRERYAPITDGANPRVMEVATPAGAFYLCRRLDPVDLLATDTLPQPLTQIVRRMMRMGMSEAQGDSDADYDRYLKTCAAVFRLAALVPPSAFLDGEIDLEAIDPDMCLPLFVDADPQPGQRFMTGYGNPPPPEGAPTLSIGVNDLTFVITVLLSAGPPNAPLLLFRHEPGGSVAGLDDLAHDALGAAV